MHLSGSKKKERNTLKLRVGRQGVLNNLLSLFYVRFWNVISTNIWKKSV